MPPPQNEHPEEKFHASRRALPELPGSRGELLIHAGAARSRCVAPAERLGYSRGFPAPRGIMLE
jgi:hypothetical protein